MAKVEFKPGDYVMTEGMDEEKYHKVARAFIDAGCPECEYPNLTYFGWHDVGAVGWSEDQGFYHQCTTYSGFTGRQLTVAQVLGEDETAMPGVGSLWVNPDNEYETLTVIGYHDGNVICWDGETSYQPYDPSELTVPAKSERDKAVEEMSRLYLDGAKGHKGGLAALYDAGFRKVES